MNYDFNILVSYEFSEYHNAKQEVINFISSIGDTDVKANATIAKGLMGVHTSLNNREVILKAKDMQFKFCIKWIPIDYWCSAEIEDIMNLVKEIKAQIKRNEKWAMFVEKRRNEKYHKIDLIKEVAELIDNKVDLDKPDKILHIEIVGKYAGICIHEPEESFSVGARF